MTTSGQQDVDAYIAVASKAAQPMLHELRGVIRAAAPQAEERISYGMPVYEQHGRVVYFAAWQKHVGLYIVGAAKDVYAKELKQYIGAKATARFPIGDPLPVGLIKKLVQFQVEANEAKFREPARVP